MIISSKGNDLLIVDGAAFGDQIGKLIRYIQSNNKECVIYAPESFKYIILNSGLLNVDKNVLDETYNYADSTEYFSWEQFFTKYLISVSQETLYKYNKSKLNKVYLDDVSVRKIMEKLPDMIKDFKGSGDR